MRRLINYAEKYSLKYFLKLLTVRLLHIVNEYHSNNRSLPSDSKLILMTCFFYDRKLCMERQGDG